MRVGFMRAALRTGYMLPIIRPTPALSGRGEQREPDPLERVVRQRRASGLSQR